MPPKTRQTPVSDEKAESAPAKAGDAVQQRVGIDEGRKKRKRKKKRYSSNLRGLQKLEVGSTKAALRLARASERSIQVWIDARDRSASKKRDGAIKDSFKNTRKAIRKATKIAPKAVSDILDAVASTRVNKAVLRALGF